MKDQTYPEIPSPRLRLVWMSPEFMQASLDGRQNDAQAEIGAALPEGWPDEHTSSVMRMRLQQIASRPESAPWLLRLMVDRVGTAAGYINFHGPPREGKAELGYTVFEPYRRLGYASEAARAMMRWAHDEHGVETFVVSISPSNAPSLAMAAKLGFVQVGTQIDEVDGEEWVFELTHNA